MSHNLNTTIDKIALSKFNTHYYQLNENEKQWCHEEMVNNSKWLQPFWKDKNYMDMSDKWKAGLPI